MLFQPQGAALVQSVFRDASLALNRKRKQDVAKRLDFYHDGQLDYLQQALAEKFADPSKLQPCFINIVRKVIDLKARCYADEPKRIIEGTEADKLLFQEIAEQAALSVKMKTASRLVKLLKTVLIRPTWRNNRLDLDILAGDIVDVSCGDSPEDLESILITHWPDDGKVEGITYSFWTVTEWSRLDYRGRILETLPNPYSGILPFVPLWDRAPSDSFWQPGGDDLIVAQEAVNKALVDLLHTMEFQGYGVGYVTGAEGGGTLQTGPGVMIELPKDASLGFAATNAQIEEVTEAIDRLMRWVAISNGIPAASLSTDPSVESGIARIVGNSELTESRQDDIALFRVFERRLFSVIRTVWNAHNVRKLSDAATLSVDFADPKPETSAKDQASTWQILMDLGLASPVDCILEKNPDITTREDAMAYLFQIKEEVAALNESKI